ncbi:MAG: S41 family peptidase [Desulfitobacteriaceae bacterium]
MKVRKRFFVVLVFIFLLFSTPTVLAGDTAAEVRSLLQNNYVDPVAQSVLDAGSIPEMLKRLGDPHTMYFSAQEYQAFLGSLEDVKFAGIGVNIEIVPEGVLVTNVLPGSAAESVGLKQGDIITYAGSQALAGLSSEAVLGLLRGPEGTQVQLTIKRQERGLNFEVTRRMIDIPTVTGQVLDKHIGYVDINTFGSDTSMKLGTVISDLRRQNVDSWIVDLRDDPGGYLSTVVDLASYFIGANEVVQVRDRFGNVTPYVSPTHGVTISQPMILLTNAYSASASEILSASIKDYKKATLLGTKTYGKGTVQSMFGLSDGSVLKMTIARFFSPLGHSINQVGVSPDILIEKSDSEKTAELLLGGLQGGAATNSSTNDSASGGTDKSGFVDLSTPENDFQVSLAQARMPEYWSSYGEILTTLSSPTVLRQGTATGWVPLDSTALAWRYPLYYPGYSAINTLDNIPLDKKFTLSFSGFPDWSTVNAQSVELINSATGKRATLEFKPINPSEAQIIPTEGLESGQTYWLILHPFIRGTNGLSMKTGYIAVAKTTGGA